MPLSGWWCQPSLQGSSEDGAAEEGRVEATAPPQPSGSTPQAAAAQRRRPAPAVPPPVEQLAARIRESARSQHEQLLALERQLHEHLHSAYREQIMQLAPALRLRGEM